LLGWTADGGCPYVGYRGVEKIKIKGGGQNLP
jgi:hypothetical protein